MPPGVRARSAVHYDRAVSAASLAATIPAPSFRQIPLGPLDIRLYALTMLSGVAVATWLTARRWRARGGDAELVLEVALWSVLAGIVGGRIYHDVTSWDQLSNHWYAPFAIWEGGLGIWGGVLAGVLAGAYVVRRRGESVTAMMDAAAPGLLIAQGIGRLGNYFNQELFGGPTDLPWGLEVDPGYRPPGDELSAVYQPTFLYEMLWNFAGAALLIWIGRRYRIAAPGIFCLYVAIYSLGRVFWEMLRVDPAHHFLGQRLNFWVALTLCIGGLVAFVWTQRRAGAGPAEPGLPRASGGAHARPARRR